MKLYRFRYSPFARKVQMVLDLLGTRYELVEVPYSDRNEIALATGGYIYVPVLVDDSGRAITESRKFGAGCVDAWQRDRAGLVQRARHLLAPTMLTLASRKFLFGDAPTLADAALYGVCKMLDEVDSSLLPQISDGLVAFLGAMETHATIL